jgi:hypothetical protein
LVLYEMATGQQAFSGGTSAAVFDAILHKAPVSPVRLNAGCPAGLERIINKVLEKEPERRYQNAAQLRDDLKRLKQDSDSSVRVAALMAPRVLLRSALKLRVVIPALLIMAALVYSAVWFFQRQAKITWARNTAIPEIERLIKDGWQNNIEAFNLELGNLPSGAE